MSNLDNEMSQTTVRKPVKRASKTTRSVFGWVEDLTFALVVVTIIFTFLIRVITVDGSSMNPNYYDGDRVIITGLTGKYDQGDVVIVTNVLEAPIIKRVIATEGQTVSINVEERAVYVDNVRVDDSVYGIENGITDLNWSNYDMLDFPAVVPEGCIFVLGDNRVISKDSRYAEVGMIDERNVLGKAILKLFPISDFGLAK